MNNPENRIYSISDYHALPQDYPGAVIDDRWPKKKLPLDPTKLYRSWVDTVAKEVDAYMYYIIDKDFSLGGTCDIAIETINKYAGNNEEGIDWFIIDLPGSKGKLNLQSSSVKDVTDLNTAVYTLHKSKDLTKVGKSLTRITDAKQSDVDSFFSKLEKLEKLMNETASYESRFIITQHCYKELCHWVDHQIDKEHKTHPRLSEWRNLANEPKTQENRPQKSLFPNLDLENEFIHMMETPIGEYSYKIRGRGKSDSPHYARGYVDEMQRQLTRPNVVFDENAQLGTLSEDNHSIVGEKLVRHLTETTKLFTI